jgi:hypothetical protein
MMVITMRILIVMNGAVNEIYSKIEKGIREVIKFYNKGKIQVQERLTHKTAPKGKLSSLRVGRNTS